MTAAEIVDALCEAERELWDERYLRPGSLARRDAIKAAMVETLRSVEPCPDCAIKGGCIICGRWRKLEEACRGKA